MICFTNGLLNTHYLQGRSRSWASIEREEEQEPDLRELSGEDRGKANRDHGRKGGANEMP